AVVSDAATELMARFWPGPLTLVLPARLPADGPTIAVRAPNHQVALALLRTLGEPIASSSANLAGALPPVDADQVIEGLGDTLELIPSENIASPAVVQALGSLLNNKYAEGYPGKRYYGGCENVDRIETLAIERAKALFNAEHANVQSHCGTTANYAVYAAVLNPGDTVLGMDLSHGGHLSHGSPVNFSGKLYHFVPYGVDPNTERIDYDVL